MSVQKDNSLWALLAGAAIGIGIGVLFAPDKGANTRARLNTELRLRIEALRIRFENLSEEMKTKLRESQFDFKAAFEDLAKNPDGESISIVSALENKLDELKEAAASLKKKEA